RRVRRRLTAAPRAGLRSPPRPQPCAIAWPLLPCASTLLALRGGGEAGRQPILRDGDHGGIGFVGARELVVVDLEACRAQDVARTPREGDPDHRVAAAVDDEDAQGWTVGEARLPALDGGDEAGEGEHAGGRGAPRV